MAQRGTFGFWRLGRAAAGLLTAAAASGCATYYEARFDPSPLEMRVEDEAVPGVLARGLATVLGVRRVGVDEERPQFELLLRVENVGARAFRVDRESFELVTADLEALRGRHVRERLASRAAEGEVLRNGDYEVLEVFFPFAPGMRYRELDLSGLALRWSLIPEPTPHARGAANADSQEQPLERVIASASFHRRTLVGEPYFYGPIYWTGPGIWRYYGYRPPFWRW